MRRRFVRTAVLGLVAAALPASAVGLPPALTSQAVVAPTPVVAQNLELVGTFPEAGAISTAFDPDKPFMYVNTLQGISSYDITNPEQPVPAGFLPLPHFENERMTIGVRGNNRFLLIGYDLFGVPATAPDKANGTGYALQIVDVTNPLMPQPRGYLETTTSVHTVHCIAKDCRYAYSAGAYDAGNFSIFDLADLDAPKEVKAKVKSLAGSGHQWDYDDAGIIWHSGFDGIAAYDISDPLTPKVLASTDKAGTEGPTNDFILHNAFRPGAAGFTQVRDEATGRLVSGSKETASPFDGNVLLATEEDYDSPDCQGELGVDAPEGGFQTWYVPYLDAAQYKTDNPQGVLTGKGKITPLDTWNTEITNTGTPTPVGALCSAHYFTYQDGFVAQAWYGQGTRILDVRNPRDIKQVGYFFTGASETWISYFVPKRDAAGKVIPGKFLDLIYTNDVVRGIDVLKWTRPTTPPAATADLTAPILSSWTQGDGLLPVTAADSTYGGVCRKVTATTLEAALHHA